MFKLLFLLLMFLASISYAKSNSTVLMNENDVITVKTKVGFSTKLIFKSRPKNGLIGDQDAFSVEYLKNVVSIKPLMANAQTNLFIPTSEGYFNFILKTTKGTPNNFLYILKKSSNSKESALSSKKRDSHEPIEEKEIKFKSKYLKKVSYCGPLSLRVHKVSWPESHSSFIYDFIIKVRIWPRVLSENIVFEARDFHLFQGKKRIHIEGIYLDRNLLSNNSLRIIGKFHIRQEDIDPRKRLKLYVAPQSLKNKKCKVLKLNMKVLSPLQRK